MTSMQARVEAYLAARDWSEVPVMARGPFQVTPLARGEYNLKLSRHGR